ncbi:MAG: hypothetical protein N3B01_10610 [Verrucomicrobiae bacterium]|nr:hypothetical protein [Verrucomicrobiae bacterium]
MFTQPSIARKALLAAIDRCPAQWSTRFTLAAVLALDHYGLADPVAEVGALDIYRREMILRSDPTDPTDPTDPQAVLRFAETIAEPPQLLCERYAAAWREACAALGELEPPEFKADDRIVEETRFGGPQTSGIGWMLPLVELFAAEYGWTVREILRLPVITAFALLTAQRLRNGWRWRGPSYETEDRLAAPPASSNPTDPTDPSNPPDAHV